MENRVSKKDFSRDPESGALVSVNNDALAAYRQKITKQQAQKRNISKMSDDINNLKEEFQEMKDLLIQVTNSLNNKIIDRD
jgi:HAMP domain-containing protein